MSKRMDLDELGKAVTGFVQGELVYDSELSEYFLYHRRRDAFRVLHGRKHLRPGTPAEYEKLNAGALELRPAGGADGTPSGPPRDEQAGGDVLTQERA